MVGAAIMSGGQIIPDNEIAPPKRTEDTGGFRKPIFGNSAPVVAAIYGVSSVGFKLAGSVSDESDQVHAWFGYASSSGDEIRQGALVPGTSLRGAASSSGDSLFVGSRGRDALVVRVSADDSVIWDQTYCDEDRIFRISARDVVELPGGQIAVAATARARSGIGPMPGVYSRRIIFWLDSTGNVLNVDLSEEDSEVYSLARVGNDHVVVTSQDGGRFVVTLVGRDGVTAWRQEVGSEPGAAYHASVAQNGDILAVGSAYVGHGRNSVRLCRIGLNGQVLWTQDFISGEVEADSDNFPTFRCYETSSRDIVVMATARGAASISSAPWLIVADCAGSQIQEQVTLEPGVVRWLADGRLIDGAGAVFVELQHIRGSLQASLVKTNSEWIAPEFVPRD